MNKTQAIENYAESYEISKVQAKAELERVFGFIQDTLAAGEELQITGFGTFSTVQKEAAVKRNPSNGEPVDVPAHKVPKFKAGRVLRSAVNN